MLSVGASDSLAAPTPVIQADAFSEEELSSLLCTVHCFLRLYSGTIMQIRFWQYYMINEIPGTHISDVSRRILTLVVGRKPVE